MHFQYWLDLIGIILVLIGSIILAIALLKSKNTIDKISQVWMFSYNPYFHEELLKDRRLGLWGISFLISGFTLQLVDYILQI